MESNFNNSDFEYFVKQNADQYRMFPSEKVWNNIHSTLHTRRRWYGIGLSLLLLTTAVVTWVMLVSPASKRQPLSKQTTNLSKIAGNKDAEPATVIILAPKKQGSSGNTTTANPNDKLRNNLFLANVTAPLDEEEEVETIAILPLNQNELKPVAVINNINKQSENISRPTPIYKETISTKPSILLADVTSNYQFIRDDNFMEAVAHPLPVAQTITDEKIIAEKKDFLPMTIESVVNSYTRISKKRKMSMQVYFLPTVSYRKLVENRSFLMNSQQVFASSQLNYVMATDINNAVTHKPDIGLEVGFNVGFPIAKNLKLTTGLQLNVSKYDIKAYPYPVVENARLALTNVNGSTSISTIESSYRNYEAFTKPDWLSTFYISASLPIGLEANLTDTRKTYLGVGGTIQPTYILGDRAYVISTDFKNYAKVPSLTRQWNVSTSFEVFAGYTTGRLKWKVGPQVRYQMLSSFEKKYPVKEHLIDFGLKVGVMLR